MFKLWTGNRCSVIATSTLFSHWMKQKLRLSASLNKQSWINNPNIWNSAFGIGENFSHLSWIGAYAHTYVLSWYAHVIEEVNPSRATHCHETYTQCIGKFPLCFEALWLWRMPNAKMEHGYCCLFNYSFIHFGHKDERHWCRHAPAASLSFNKGEDAMKLSSCA